MKLKNRFKNRFISHEWWIEWFSARNFRAGVIACLANKNFRKNWQYTIKRQLSNKNSKKLSHA